MIVVDASAMLELLLRTEAGETIEARLFAPGEAMHAPHLLDIEIAQVLRRYAAGAEISAARGQSALDDLAAQPLTRWPHDFLLRRVWALRHNLAAYDAAYAALAEALDCPLLTRDRKLATAAGDRIAVELV